ncbi:hypothetical protein [Azospirillum sp. B2RO_4]|uniref:hypothetical protein n=1 Tax=Azospirillum sp. B2RO_4 TaxID=3027796 RepID=UPI003DAA27D1
MRLFLLRFVITTMAVSLSGCESLKVINAPEARGTQGGDVAIYVVGEGSMASTGEEESEDFDKEKYVKELPEAVKKECIYYQSANILGATAIPLILAGVNIAYNQAADAFKDAMLAKIARFQQTYEGQKNVKNFIPAANEKASRCVEIRRSITGDDGKPLIASQIVLGFADAGSSALQIKPVYVRFNRFAASTQPDPKGNAVDVAVTVGIITLASDGGEPGLRRYEQNIKLRNVPLGQDYAVSKVPPTAIFPRLPARPATIVMAVTETGKGFGEFEGFEKAFEANREIIGVALGNAIETRLNAIAAGTN